MVVAFVLVAVLLAAQPPRDFACRPSPKFDRDVKLKNDDVRSSLTLTHLAAGDRWRNAAAAGSFALPDRPRHAAYHVPGVDEGVQIWSACERTRLRCAQRVV